MSLSICLCLIYTHSLVHLSFYLSAPAVSSLTTIADLKARKQRGQVLAPHSGTYSVSIPALYADTRYTVYCYTEDLRGHSMPMNTLQNTFRYFTTVCCRQVRFSRKTSTIITSTQSSTFSSSSSSSSGSSNDDTGEGNTIFAYQLDSSPPRGIVVR